LKDTLPVLCHKEAFEYEKDIVDCIQHNAGQVRNNLYLLLSYHGFYVVQRSIHVFNLRLQLLKVLEINIITLKSVLDVFTIFLSKPYILCFFPPPFSYQNLTFCAPCFHHFSIKTLHSVLDVFIIFLSKLYILCSMFSPFSYQNFTFCAWFSPFSYQNLTFCS